MLIYYYGINLYAQYFFFGVPETVNKTVVTQPRQRYVTVKTIISSRQVDYYKSVSPSLQSQSSPRFSDNSQWHNW